MVLRGEGVATALEYARCAAQATVEGTAVGYQDLMDLIDKTRPIRRREYFILGILRGALRGLSFMHARGRLHQSLGPASVVLK